MNRNSFKLLGLLLILPSVFFGLMPFLAEHTAMLNRMIDLHWSVNGRLITDFHKDLNGKPVAQTWWGVWIVAVVGEMCLLGVNVFAPIRPNRFKINIHD